MAKASTILLAVESVPPSELRLFRAGKNETSKGTFVFDDEAAALVMAAFADHGADRLPFDFDHGMFAQVSTSESSKAAGWFVPEVRGGELWATNIEWTPTADRMLRDREFRFFSPAFDRDDEDRVTKLWNVALTNLPATKDQPPMVASQAQQDLFAGNRNQTINRPTTGTPEHNRMETLLAKLSARDEAAAVEAVDAIKKNQNEFLAATGASSPVEAVAIAAEHRKSVVELTARVAMLEAEKDAREKDSLIAEYSKTGQAPPAAHSALRKLSVEQIREVCEALPKAAPPVTEAASGEAVALSDAQKRVADLAGVSHEAMIETIKLEQAR